MAKSEIERLIKRNGRTYRDPRKKQLTIKDMRENLEDARAQRRIFENDWWLNLGYINNEQHVDYVLETGRLVEKAQNEDENLVINNQMLKIQRIERAKILRAMPVPKAIPASPSMEARETARILSSWFEQVRWDLNLDQRLRRASYWLTATGNVFFKWLWDDATKKPIIDVLSPFEVYGDPFARRFDESRWLITEQFLSEEAVWDMYGDLKDANLEHIVTGRGEPLSPVEQRIYSDVGTGNRGNLSGVTLYEYYEPPRAGGFRGRYIVFTKSGFLWEAEEYPFVHGQIPVTHVAHIERSTSKYAASIMDVLRPMQDEIQRTENQIIQNRVMTNGKWMIPVDVTLDQEINNEPRQIIRWEGNPITSPSDWMVTGQALPNWAKDEVQRYASQMSDLASQHEVSNAQVPGRVESGTSIQLLQESDDSVLKDTIMSLEESISRGFMMLAQYLKERGDQQTLVNIYDPERGASVEYLMRDKIDLINRIEVQTTTALPTTIAGKRDFVTNLVEIGVIPPEQAAKLLDLSTAEPSLDPTLSDRQRAYAENKLMAEGEWDIDEATGEPVLVNGQPPPVPKPWEDAMAHLEIHREFMNSDKFDTLPEPNRQAFIFHFDVTNQEVQAMQQAQMAAEQGGQQGGPPQQ